MRLPSFFIQHPVITCVINIMIIVLGVLSVETIPLQEYPKLSFPTITVTASLPNASAELMEQNVTSVLEEALGGVEGLTDIKSRTSNSVTSIDLTFESNFNLDKAMMNIRDAYSTIKAHLPKNIQEPLIQKKSVNQSGMPFIAISFESAALSVPQLVHYLHTNIINTFKSIPNMGKVNIWGEDYRFDVALDQKKLYLYGINPHTIYSAVENGQLSLPVGRYQKVIPANLSRSLSTVQDFEDLIIKPKTEKEPEVSLRNVANLTLSKDNQNPVIVGNNKGVVIGLYLAMEANPVESARNIYAKITEIKTQLPKHIKMNVILDQSVFIKSSLQTIQSSIFEAIILVLLIVFFFLGSFRATLIPMIAIPISLVGTFLLLTIFGFSINSMTLLAMVLATGLVVDDAIVVLENCAHHIENGLSPIQAALIGSKEIGFAILAMTFTLCSVYAPLLFLKGPVGQLFKEFAVALSGSVLLSGFVALSLTPLMCAKMLQDKTTQQNYILQKKFNGFLKKIEITYAYLLKKLMSKIYYALLFLALMISVTIFLIKSLPHETMPSEDRGFVGFSVPGVEGKNVEDMEKILLKASAIVGEMPETDNQLMFYSDSYAVSCYSLVAKQKRNRSAEDIKNTMQQKLLKLPSYDVYAWNYSSGLPNFDGSEGNTIDITLSTTLDYKTLYTVGQKILEQARKNPLLLKPRIDLEFDAKSFDIVVNRAIATRLGIDESEIAKTLEIFFEGNTALKFSKDNILYNINIYGKNNIWDPDSLYLFNALGQPVSLGTLVQFNPTTKPASLNHINQLRALKISVDPNTTLSIQDNMNILQKIVDDITPSTIKKSWTGAADTVEKSSGTMMRLFFLSLLFIFAILAMQCENFLDPLIVLITVPLGCFGAMITVWLFGQTVNIYTQVGLITLIGLISKNGILIVEFANQILKNSVDVEAAIIDAAKRRLRPILMTSCAMILGALPLLISSASGAESRHVIATVLIGGLCIGKAFTVFIVPIFYNTLKSLNFFKI